MPIVGYGLSPCFIVMSSGGAGGADVTAPTLSSAVIDSAGTSLTLTYNEALDDTSEPVAGDFALNYALLSAITAVNVTGSTVVLTLAPAVSSGETGITLDYTPGAAPTQDLAGNDAAALTGQAVTNNSTHAFSPGDLTNALFWLRGDSYVESGGAGTGVTQATDLSAAAEHFTNAGGTARPTAVATVVSANNQPGWTFDGTTDRLDNTGLSRPAPGTTPTWFWMVVVVESYTTNEVLFCGVGTNTMIIQQATADPLIRMLNPTGANSNSEFVTFPACKRLEWEFTNSTGDFLRIGDTLAIGSNSGNNSTTGFRIGVNNGGTVFGHMTLLDCLAMPGFPGAAILAQLEAYGATRYGSGPFS